MSSRIQGSKRFQGLDLINRVPEELWMEVHNTGNTGGGDQNHLQEKEMQKRQNVYLRRTYKQLRKKESKR